MSSDVRFSRLAYPALGVIQHENEAAAQAESRGYAVGYAAGLRAAERDAAEQAARHEAEHAARLHADRARVGEALGALQAAARDLASRTVPVIASAQDTLAAAALDLAEAVIGCELQSAGSSASAALHRALDGVDPASVRRVRLHPRDLAVLQDVHDGELPAGVPIVADASLAPGDAVTDFEDGFLDARISMALVRARAALLESGTTEALSPAQQAPSGAQQAPSGAAPQEPHR